MMTSRHDLLVLASAVLLAAAGCNPVDMATRGFKEVKGTAAEIRVIQDLPAAEMADYSGIRVGRVASSVGDLVPPDFVAQVSSDLRTQLGGLDSIGRRGSPLVVNADITYYQTQGTTSVLLGKDKMAIMHVVAVAGGNKVADILAIASSEALRTGDVEMAHSLASSVANYFKQKLPKAAEER